MDDVRSPDVQQRRAPRPDPAEEARCIAEDAAAIEAFNAWDGRHGSPLDRFRKA